jgi:5-deoxy-5-amino-3-dehydroquinate synthase
VTERIEVGVELPDGRRCPVVVGRGVRSELASVVPRSVQRVAVVTQANIGVEVDPGVPSRVFNIGDGEQHKNLDTIGALCSDWSKWGLTRADMVVSVGGGMVTDVGGFAASVYHRGLPVVHVSTTLLGQVDAAVGGKTGVNIPEGKNLVGSFWQPKAVFCDTETLDTLSDAEWRCGMGEVAKYHWLGGDNLAELTLEQRVAECVRIKAEVVAADEREAGGRALLNYGHTFAHAIETVGNHGLKHGEAVGVGLICAAELARLMGRIDDDSVSHHREVVSGYGIETNLPGDLDHTELLAAMGRDKKVLDGGLTFVLLGDHGLEVVADVDPALARKALECSQ